MTAAAADPGAQPGSTALRDSPLSTYRLQFTPRFRLADALAIVPYLAALGITHVYASPFLKARPGSDHGYDITDHNAINPEIGDWSDFVAFTDALHDRDMGLILDFVPNHMGIGKADNAWWLDVLEWGQDSPYARYFDIDWTPFKPELAGKVLLPMLGDYYGAVLAAGELKLAFDAAEGSLAIWYHEHKLPLRARSYAVVIRRGLAQAGDALEGPARAALEQLAVGFDGIRRAGASRRDDARARAAVLKRDLAALCHDAKAVHAFLAGAVAAFDGKRGDGDAHRALHGLLERQFYRLAFWRVAADEINYRRFFNINELAGIRIEDRGLFEIVHGLVGRMIREGRLQGLRLDHIDGLFDPEAYCRRLQDFARAQRGGDGPFYVVIEKILARHETLRADWPIDGTTGYEFVSLVNGLFVDGAGERGLDHAYRRAVGTVPPFEDTVLDAKDTVISTLLSGELSVLANAIDRISERDWVSRDYTMQRLRDALREVVRHFRVYRTYVSERWVTADDRREIDWAVARAWRSWRGPDREIFDFLHAALTGDLLHRGAPYRRPEVLRFAQRFQQYTGPIMAKSLEDTAFYRHHRLISLNEVGGEPSQFGISVAAFHHANRQRALHWPRAMVATATHDTKRGEDARLRIDVLSEMAEDWDARVAHWSALNRPLRRPLDGGLAPSDNDEYLLYQALIGACPVELLGAEPQWEAAAAFAPRIEAFAIKAAREAKLRTSWDSVSEPYERALKAFVRGLLPPRRTDFLADFLPFAARVARIGMLNGVAQAVLRLTVPGVADTYQGTEIWDLNLVDPDNRRPVDFGARRALLERVSLAPESDSSARFGEMLHAWHDGAIKLAVINRLLRLRRRHPRLFLAGGYTPLDASGERADHAVAFIRSEGALDVLVICGRLFVSLQGNDTGQAAGTAHWGDTHLPGAGLAGRWRDQLTGAIHDLDAPAESGVAVARLLGAMPATVLLRDSR